MKFLNVYCESRKAEVFISLDKIVLIQKTEDENMALITLEGSTQDLIKVALPAEDVIRKINGEERIGIGFRRSI